MKDGQYMIWDIENYIEQKKKKVYCQEVGVWGSRCHTISSQSVELVLGPKLPH